MADVPLMNNPMTTAGDVIYGGASGAPSRLAVGTAGQVLKVNAGATAPEWGAAAAGTPTFVGAKAYSAATQTLTTATATAVALELEEYDSNTFHDLATNNSRF